jgi:signal transduction histidine kinase
MKVGCDRIRNISTSLRTFSRADTSQKVSADIHEGIDSTLMILQHRLKANADSPAIQVVKEYGNIPKVKCYLGQLNQVFMNILANAIDCFEESNKSRSFKEIELAPNIITIATEIDNDNQIVTIKIRDNGRGIPEEVLSRIFDHLFTTKGVGKGTGLGLSISRQIVAETHGGKLTCDSVVGEGTEFTIALPLD